MINNKGFTLIELLVVVAIIALLSSVVLTSLQTATAKAKVASALTEMTQLQDAVEQYNLANGSYPGAGTMTGLFSNWNDQSSTNNTLLNNTGAGEPYALAPTYIASIPDAPNYLSNCPNGAGSPNCYVLGYTTYTNKMIQTTYGSGASFYCGNQPVQNYAIFLYDSNGGLNLPKLYNYLAYPYSNDFFTDGTLPLNTYCISG